MGQLIVSEFVTLDGVMQAPSGPHSRLYAQFEVRGGGPRRFPAPPGVQRRQPRRVQRSRFNP